MKKTTRICVVLSVVIMILCVFCTAQTDITVDQTSHDVVVCAKDNQGMGFDIKEYIAGGNVYLFLPADVDVSQLTVRFGDVCHTLDLSSPKSISFSNGVHTMIAMQTNLPVLNMQIDESRGTIKSMNSDPEHDTKCYGTFQLEVPEELASKNGWQSVYSDDESVIKGRGNATWSLDKKAYQIKLGKKQSILEMGKHKTWIILANHGDRSLIRNKLAYDFAKDMGLKYSLDSEFIDVYFNGEYQGNYLLTEKVELGEQRIDIYDLEEPDQNPDADRVTGGYLIEYDRLAKKEPSWTTGPKTGLLITIKSPEETTPEQKEYITNFINNMEYAIYAKDGMSPEGKHYSEYMDIDSFIKLYWVNEVFKNGDFFYGSTFMYKDVGADQKLYSGPAWDYDISLANACSNAGATTAFRQENLANPLGWWVRTVSDGLSKQLFNHQDFSLRNKELYDEIVQPLIMAMPQKALEYAEYIEKSANMNFIRWNVLKKDHQWQTPNKAITYRGEVNFVKNYLEKRVAWINDVMHSDMEIGNLGTKDNPIKISSADDLRKLSDNVNNGNSYVGYYILGSGLLCLCCWYWWNYKRNR